MLFKALSAAAALTAGAAWAQSAALPKYESALSGYQPYADEKRASWREVNDTAGRLGGHNGHLRENLRAGENSGSGTGAATAIDTPAPPAAKPVNPHAGHNMAAPQAAPPAASRPAHDMQSMGGAK